MVKSFGMFHIRFLLFMGTGMQFPWAQWFVNFGYFTYLLKAAYSLYAFSVQNRQVHFTWPWCWRSFWHCLLIWKACSHTVAIDQLGSSQTAEGMVIDTPRKEGKEIILTVGFLPFPWHLDCVLLMSGATNGNLLRNVSILKTNELRWLLEYV